MDVSNNVFKELREIKQNDIKETESLKCNQTENIKRNHIPNSSITHSDNIKNVEMINMSLAENSEIEESEDTTCNHNVPSTCDNDSQLSSSINDINNSENHNKINIPTENNIASNCEQTTFDIKNIQMDYKINRQESSKRSTSANEIHNVIMITDNTNSNYTNNIKYVSSNVNLNSSDGKSGKETPFLANSNTVVRFSPLWNQTLAASAAILLTFTAGLTTGFSAVLLPQLKSPDSLIPGDETSASWIASMAALPMAPGCLLSGWLMEKFGRKTSLYIICAPFLLSWILIACAKNLTVMLIGRFLSGLCVGLLGPLGPVYIGETTDPVYRGFFLAAVSLAIAIGILVAHLIGTFMTWQWTATICSLFPILSTLLLLIAPESPTWLISKKRIEDGVKSFGWLRGHDEQANAELKGLLNKQKEVEQEPQMNWKEKLATLKSPELLKPLMIMILFFLTCQFSGVNAVAFYSIDIVQKAVGTGFDHYVAMLTIDGLRTVMSVVACVTCKRYGRRPLCFISGVWTALSMVGLSMYLYFTEGKSTANLSWIPLTCLLVYISAISIGLVPLPWIMCGEVFPTKVRGLGSGISSAMTFAAFFLVVKSAPGMLSSLGEVVTFLTYGTVAFVGTIIMYFILPETKGKSLQEIEEKFKSRPKT